MQPTPSRRSAWSSLVRLPNVFTVVADVSAAFLLVGGWPHDAGAAGRWAAIVVAGVLLYWSGMILNDVFDVEKDRIERPHRPLPAGQISIRSAQTAAVICMIGGIAMAAISGLIPAAGLRSTIGPAVVALILGGCIYLYDGPAKRTVAAAYLMGGCRFLSFLLGASPVALAGDWIDPIAGFPRLAVAAAWGFGLYIAGLTLVGRKEAAVTSTASSHVSVGAVLTLLGLIVIAMSPRASSGEILFRIDPRILFPGAIAMIGYPIVLRAFRAAVDPVAGKVQMTVRSGILTIIPLSGCVAVLGAGAAGAVVFALWLPAYWLSMRYRVT